MEPIVNRIHSTLIKNKKTVSVAESCTGGLLANLLTLLPGSASYFILGIVAYNNKVKAGLLKVPAPLIAKRGAVSQEVAEKLAQNVRKIAKTEYGIGVTGIAGPTGATPNKPPGTVYIAIATKKKTICRRLNFKGNRASIRHQSAIQALKLLLLSI